MVARHKAMAASCPLVPLSPVGIESEEAAAGGRLICGDGAFGTSAIALAACRPKASAVSLPACGRCMARRTGAAGSRDGRVPGTAGDDAARAIRPCSVGPTAGGGAPSRPGSEAAYHTTRHSATALAAMVPHDVSSRPGCRTLRSRLPRATRARERVWRARSAGGVAVGTARNSVSSRRNASISARQAAQTDRWASTRARWRRVNSPAMYRDRLSLLSQRIEIVPNQMLQRRSEAGLGAEDARLDRIDGQSQRRSGLFVGHTAQAMQDHDCAEL